MQRLCLILLPLLLSACMSTAQVETAPEPWRLKLIDSAPTDFEKARQAILSMVGEYRVTFAFEETEALTSGYQLKPAKQSDAYEMVLLAEDSDTRIILQHILVHRGSGFVIKHWRQDWRYEAPRRLRFTADQTWRLRPVSAEKTKGAWTQCVYEVSDAPRYCGTGRWDFAGEYPTWTSDQGYRPLPRREYTKRDDYNALAIINSHTILPDGWNHGQDNVKVVREGETVVSRIAREKGLNTYQRISGYNFRPGYQYWDDTQDYWRRIRAEWDRRIAAGDGVRLDYPVDGMKMIMKMYWQSEKARKGKPVTDQEIQDLFDPWVKAP
ncbi:hypothetical protein A6D6_01141 [Alcanivorax xiamenensis]|uniref:Lipoprotein n=2 Tax=Alcanivoracaceae TaxID=224372 RepID=A0ABQ6YB89_9GAMM|nr:hypothetical protein A6D6_01141 [Alcanivorax xiamenensis]